MADESETFPRLRARTQRFTLGEPRTISICANGQRILFLRAAAGDDARTGLWVLDLPDGEERAVVDPAADDNLPAAERMRRERTREGAAGVVSYAVDLAGTVAAFALGGRLQVVAVDSGEVTTLGEASACFDPRPDPTGRRVAYVDGRDLRVVEIDGGGDRVLVDGVDSRVSWGRAEFVAAEEMDRFRGFWWAPDGQALLVSRVDESAVQQWWIADPAHPDREPTAVRYPAAGTPNADVTLWRVGLSGELTEISWDRDRYPYLARVSWSAPGPLLQVVSRDQQATAVLTVDVTTGATTIRHLDRDEAWVEPHSGVPAWLGEDRVVRIAIVDGAQSLLIDDVAVTPPELYVRSVVSVESESITFTGSEDDPTQVAVYRWSAAGLIRLSESAGVHRAVASEGTLVLSSATLDTVGTATVVRTEVASQPLASYAVAAP